MEEIKIGNGKLIFIERNRPMEGILRYKVFNNGVLLEEVEEKNLIVNGARNQMARLIAGDFQGRNITKIAFGVSGTAPVVGDETLTNPFIKELSGFSFPEMGQVQFDWELTIHEANGKAILEFGLITEDDTLFSRRIRDNGKPIHKESDISIIGQWIIIF